MIRCPDLKLEMKNDELFMLAKEISNNVVSDLKPIHIEIIQHILKQKHRQLARTIVAIIVK